MRTIEQMVQQEVMCCMSSLVATIAQGGVMTDTRNLAKSGQDAIRAMEDLYMQANDLCAPIPDYEEAAIQEGWKHVGTEKNGEMLFSRGASIIGADVVRADSWQSLCESSDSIEPYDREVFEHWAVTQWLADKLAAAGEKVDNDFGVLCVWARTTTGQAISADGVIEQIYKEMMKAA